MSAETRACVSTTPCRGLPNESVTVRVTTLVDKRVTGLAKVGVTALTALLPPALVDISTFAFADPSAFASNTEAVTSPDQSGEPFPPLIAKTILPD